MEHLIYKIIYYDIMSLKQKALKLGATDLGESKVKYKRYYVIYNGKKINFGSRTGETYLEHKDDKKRDAWYARHSKIKNKSGEYVINDKTSSSFWSAKILW